MRRLLAPAAGAVLAVAACLRPPAPGGPARTPSPAALVIAHRGASYEFPEHTLLAYERAVQSGADYIEQDLQMTRDGQLVVMHDETLDRTVRGLPEDCMGLVIEHTLAQVRRCDAGLWFTQGYPSRLREPLPPLAVPTLQDVVRRFGSSTRYYIETKNPESAPGMEDSLLAVLGRNGLGRRAMRDGRVVVQSFSERSLRIVRARSADVPLVQLLEDRIRPESLDTVLPRIAAYADGIGPSWRFTDSLLIARAHAAGLVVHAYTVNDADVLRRLLGWGVDGVFTDKPRDARSQVPMARGGRALRRIRVGG